MKDTSLSTESSMNSDLVMAIYLSCTEKKSEIQDPIIIGTMMDDVDMIAEKLRFAVKNAKTDDPMQIRNIYNKFASLSLSSHKSVVLDVPLTFNTAIKPLSQSSNIFQKRPHAATVGHDSKVNTSSILKSNRQRGDSEPLRVSTPIEKKKKVIVEPPPIEDRKYTKK